MKKFLSILFLLSSPAFAIDRPIPCTGNSCKLLFETTGSGGAKVSSGEASGLGVWKLGPTDVTTSAAIHEIRNGNGANTNGTNTLLVQTGNQGAHAARLKIQNSTGGLSDIFETTVGSGVTTFRNGTPTSLGSVDNTTGAWTFGASGGTSNHMVIGNLNVKSNVPGNIGNNLGIFTATSAASQSCDTTCSTEPSGMNSSSGTCIKQWTNGGVPEATTTVGTGKICLCVAIN